MLLGWIQREGLKKQALYDNNIISTISVSLLSASVKPKNNVRRFSSILLLSSGNDTKLNLNEKCMRVHCACAALVIGHAC